MMARSDTAFKNLAKPLKPLLVSALEQMDASLASGVLPSVSRKCWDPVEVKALYEEFGGILIDECFGRAFYTIPFVGHLASPVAIRMGISDFAERECRTLHLCRAATELEVAMILLAQVTGADVSRVRAGRLGDDEWDRLVAWLEGLNSLEFSVLQVEEFSLPMLRDWVKETAEESSRRPFVVIDDELLIAKNRQANIDGLTELSEKYGAAIAVVAHLPPN
jgi:hypothetical protein